MHHTTFDTLVHRAAGLQDRRSLLGGLGAALLPIAGLPLAAEAKKKRKRNNKNKRSKACKKRVNECRRELLPGCEVEPEGCENFIKKCCEKACKSVDDARRCFVGG
jgi:hypothetical protein